MTHPKHDADGANVSISKNGTFPPTFSKHAVIEEKFEQVYISPEDVVTIFQALNEKPKKHEKMAKAHTSARLLFS